MRATFNSLCLATLAVVGISIAGCGTKSTTDATTGTQSGHYEGDGHDHSGEEAGHFEGDGHNHGNEAAHAHPTEGPHGGHLIELGDEEYHAELLHDESTHTVTIYLLDSSGKQPTAVSQPEITVQLFQGGQFVKYALKAVQEPGSPAGAASRFEIADTALCDALCQDEKITGRLQLTIGGKPYTGTIEHSNHGDHEHDEDAGHEH